MKNQIFKIIYNKNLNWIYGVTVSTSDSESVDPSSNLGRSFLN